MIANDELNSLSNYSLFYSNNATSHFATLKPKNISCVNPTNMSTACQAPKIKFLECVLTSKCYQTEKSFDKCVRKWKQQFDDGDPDPPCYHERRVYWLCRHDQFNPRVRFKGNRYANPEDSKE